MSKYADHSSPPTPRGGGSAGSRRGAAALPRVAEGGEDRRDAGVAEARRGVAQGIAIMPSSFFGSLGCPSEDMFKVFGCPASCLGLRLCRDFLDLDLWTLPPEMLFGYLRGPRFTVWVCEFLSLLRFELSPDIHFAALLQALETNPRPPSGCGSQQGVAGGVAREATEAGWGGGARRGCHGLGLFETRHARGIRT